MKFPSPLLKKKAKNRTILRSAALKYCEICQSVAEINREIHQSIVRQKSQGSLVGGRKKCEICRPIAAEKLLNKSH